MTLPQGRGLIESTTKPMDAIARLETDRPSVALPVVPITPQRAFEGVEAQIRSLIMSGRLKPGDRLPAERDLAARFNVSRSTLREALRALELAGMLQLRKGATGGAFVRSGDSDVVAKGLIDLYHLGAIAPRDLTEARIGITEAVVRAACERISEEELAALDENVAQAARADAAGEFDERTRFHQRFHVLLAESTRNPILIANMRGIMEIVRLFVSSIGPSDNAYVLPSRRRFMKYLHARDAAAATAEMVKALQRLHRNYMVLWEQRVREESR
jgi:DNA-binding FadR family transcriptional regulator